MRDGGPGMKTLEVAASETGGAAFQIQALASKELI